MEEALSLKTHFILNERKDSKTNFGQLSSMHEILTATGSL